MTGLRYVFIRFVAACPLCGSRVDASEVMCSECAKK